MYATSLDWCQVLCAVKSLNTQDGLYGKCVSGMTCHVNLHAADQPTQMSLSVSEGTLSMQLTAFGKTLDTFGLALI